MEELGDGESGGDAEGREEIRVRSASEWCRDRCARRLDSPDDGSEREHLKEAEERRLRSV